MKDPSGPASTSSPKPVVITDLVWNWFTLRVARVRGTPVPGWFWVVLLWAVMAFPAASLRSAHLEEGTVIGLARGAVEDGYWLSPHLYGERFVERPVLLSWIAAGIGKLFGGVTVWSVRVPHLLFLLAGGLMVFDLVKARTRDAPALFGALCWFACPMVAQKFVTAEPDVTLSVLMFGSFFLWWKGVSRGRVSLSRWLAIGFLLAAAALTKGPQPLAYFVLGVGGYLLIKRRWSDIPGFVLAIALAGAAVGSWYWTVMEPGDLHMWMFHSRLFEGMSLSQWMRDHLDFLISIFVEWLPGSLLLGPVIVSIARKETLREDELVLALLLYAGLSTIALLLWSGGVATRYAMPANLSLAALSGIMFERWWTSRPWLIGAGNTVAIAISCYLVVLGWLVLPLAPDAFRRSKIAAQGIEAVRTLMPGPLLVSDAAADTNILAHVAAPIRVKMLSEIEQIQAPVLAFLTPADITALTVDKPGFRVVAHAMVDGQFRVVELHPN